VLHETVGDLADEICRDSKADALETTAATKDRGIDADEPALNVHERTTGVAGIDRGVGLDEVFVLLNV
jgi:hypothetical protein